MAGNHIEAGGEAAFTELSPHTVATAPVCTTPPPYAHGTVNKTRSTSQSSMIPSHCLCLEEVSYVLPEGAISILGRGCSWVMVCPVLFGTCHYQSHVFTCKHSRCPRQCATGTPSEADSASRCFAWLKQNVTNVTSSQLAREEPFHRCCCLQLAPGKGRNAEWLMGE